jgi:hypothetical protein
MPECVKVPIISPIQIFFERMKEHLRIPPSQSTIHCIDIVAQLASANRELVVSRPGHIANRTAPHR